MRAALSRTAGDLATVSVEDVPALEVPPGAVRVGIRAAAVNFPDVLIIADQYQMKAPRPLIPGSEFSGVVLEVGDGVTAWAEGDRVFGSTFVGAFAEEVVVPAASLTAVPAGVADHVAAAFGVAHRTAYHVLRSVAEVGEGDEVVVLGAGGGVGLAAVQLASLLGARVTAVASSPHKLEVATALGAHRAIDHRSQDLRAALRQALPDGADAVVDPVGGALSEPALRSLRWGGRFVTVGFASGTIPRIPLNLVLLKGCQVLGFEIRSFPGHAPEEAARNERELLAMLADGRAYPHVEARYGLEEAVEALRHVADGRAVGKVVIDVGPPGA